LKPQHKTEEISEHGGEKDLTEESFDAVLPRCVSYFLVVGQEDHYQLRPSFPGRCDVILVPSCNVPDGTIVALLFGLLSRAFDECFPFQEMQEQYDEWYIRFWSYL
jgi:hypothetical protein